MRKSPGFNFDVIKQRIEAIADLCRSGVECEQPAAYFRGLDTELKALRCWVDIDREQRAGDELDELRAAVASVRDDVSKLHASGTDIRAAETTGRVTPSTWRQ